MLLNGIWLPQVIVNTLTKSPMLLLYQLQAGLMESVTAVTPASFIAQPSGNTNIQAGGTSFSVTATAGATLQWQSQRAGGPWINLSNNPPYSGVTTSTLHITNAPFFLDSTKYRVVLSRCPNNLASNVLQLFVRSVKIPHVNSCLGDTVSIPIQNPLIDGAAYAF